MEEAMEAAAVVEEVGARIAMEEAVAEKEAVLKEAVVRETVEEDTAVAVEGSVCSRQGKLK